MGSPEELANMPQRTDDLSPAPSKAESIDMDLYIDPKKERKMMLKFDVSAPSKTDERVPSLLTSIGLRHWHVRFILHDGQPGSRKSRKRKHRRHE
jgi:hypothetical protein